MKLHFTYFILEKLHIEKCNPPIKHAGDNSLRIRFRRCYGLARLKLSILSLFLLTPWNWSTLHRILAAFIYFRKIFVNPKIHPSKSGDARNSGRSTIKIPFADFLRLIAILVLACTFVRCNCNAFSPDLHRISRDPGVSVLRRYRFWRIIPRSSVDLPFHR